MRIGQTSIIAFLSQALTSVIGFLVTVYLARELGTELLGTYFLVVAASIWLKVVTGQGIFLAVTKRMSEGRSPREFYGAGAVLQSVAFVVVALVLFALRKPLNEQYFGFQATVPLIGLLFVTLMLKLVQSALRGNHKVHVASSLSPFERTVRSVLQVGGVFLGYSVLALVVGYAIATLVTAVVGIALVGLLPRIPSRDEVESLWSYAKYAWPSGLEAQAFQSMDTIVLGLFVAKGFIGIYEVSWNLASILAVFGVSISQSMFPHISELTAEEDAEAAAGLVEDALAYAGLLIVPGFVGVALLGEDILRIYGEEFTDGAVILVVLVLARLVYVYESQFTNVLGAINRERVAFRVNVVFIGINLVLNFALIPTFGWYGAAAATTISAVIGLALGYGFLVRIVPVSIPVTELSRQWLAAGVMGIVVFAGDRYLPEMIPVTVALITLGAAVYFLALSVLSPRFRATVKRNLPTAR